MPPFPKPTFNFAHQVQTEVAALRHHRATRLIPAKASIRLLIATWNIANLGVQYRRGQDYQLMAEMLSWFDLVAIQDNTQNRGVA